MRYPGKLRSTGSARSQRERSIRPLLRLEKNNMVSAVYRQSELGPKRKYYSLTDKGKTELEQFAKNYRELSAAVERLFYDVEDGRNE